eukprot:11800-Heterococcus_DN1.PRE.2
MDNRTCRTYLQTTSFVMQQLLTSRVIHVVEKALVWDVAPSYVAKAPVMMCTKDSLSSLLCTLSWGYGTVCLQCAGCLHQRAVHSSVCNTCVCCIRHALAHCVLTFAILRLLCVLHSTALSRLHEAWTGELLQLVLA